MSYTPSGFSARIFTERYGFTPTETFEEACTRVAAHIASPEKDDCKQSVYQLFYDELLSNRFCPGGRIWYGAGRPKGQLMNCFVIPSEDSREGWGKTVSDMIVISGTGGGVGINCSPVRPRGSAIAGHSGTATGAVSLMEIINAAGEVIRAGGGRRTALMLCLNHNHPDIPEFLNKKLDLHQLNNANVSIVFMDESPDDFLRKVERDEKHDLLFGDRVVASMPARDLWNKMLENAVACGEPGILNFHLANSMSNLYYDRPLTSTNPCGEIALEDYGSCDLGALVLPRFVTESGKMNWIQLGRSITLAVRFLDNVLDANVYPLREIEENCKQVRRLGLGVMGLHDMLIRLGLKYSEPAALEFVDKLFSFIKNKAYRASCYLAAEKGSFPALDRDKFLESGFCKTLKIGLLEDIRTHGIRNCALLTIAPTGTTSIVSGVTSGIEPMYAYAYKRRYRSGDNLREEVVEHPLFTEMKQKYDKVNLALFESALEIDPVRHLAMQATCQRHVDNAISKTINLPKSYTGQELDGALRSYIGQLKGITLYRDGSRGESPIEPLTYEEAVRLQDCPNGVCEVA